MAVRIVPTPLDGVLVVEPRVFGDARGWFFESWSRAAMAEAGLDVDFVQDNHSFSAARGTLRGLHFQIGPAVQGKLVRCSRGSILDVAVDLRRGSPTYRRSTSVVLDARSHRQLWIPRGFAHGFLTLEPDCEVQYKADAPYAPAFERGVRFDDPELGIDWGGVAEPVLSDKDRAAPRLADSDCDFVWEGRA